MANVESITLEISVASPDNEGDDYVASCDCPCSGLFRHARADSADKAVAILLKLLAIQYHPPWME